MSSPFNAPAYNLLPARIAKNIPKLGETLEQDDPVVHVKWFTASSSWTWYVIEFDPESRIAYGFVCGHEDEFGTFSLTEILELRRSLGLTVERDLWFDSQPVSKIVGSP